MYSVDSIVVLCSIAGILSLVYAYPKLTIWLKLPNNNFYRTLFNLSKFKLGFYPYWSFYWICFIVVYLIIMLLVVLKNVSSWKDDFDYPTFGYMAICHFGFAPLLSLKRSPLTLLGFSGDKMLQLHIFLASFGIIFAFIHAGLYVKIYLEAATPDFPFLEILGINQRNWVGVYTVFILILVFISSSFPVRRLSFQFFKFVHVLAYPVIVYLIYLHAKESAIYLWPALFLFLLDYVIRIVNSLKPLESHVDVVGNQFLKLSVTSDLANKVRPGQWFLVYHNFKYHPFSVTKSHDGVIGFGIKKGKFSNIVEKRIGSMDADPDMEMNLISSNGSSSLTYESNFIRLDGPYGVEFTGIFSMKNICLIAGGIGITPIMGIISSAPEDVNIQLHWTVKEEAMILGFEKELLEAKQKGLTVNCYITKEKSETKVESFTLQHGRPNLQDILSKFKADHEGHLGIAVCGPDSLTNNVIQLSKTLSDERGFCFVFSETFI
ncbi:hypothetical protein BC833DRAFT_600536, partial [Globomyces pollinis-pini]